MMSGRAAVNCASNRSTALLLVGCWCPQSQQTKTKTLRCQCLQGALTFRRRLEAVAACSSDSTCSCTGCPLARLWRCSSSASVLAVRSHSVASSRSTASCARSCWLTATARTGACLGLYKWLQLLLDRDYAHASKFTADECPQPFTIRPRAQDPNVTSSLQECTKSPAQNNTYLEPSGLPSSMNSTQRSQPSLPELCCMREVCYH